MTTTVPDAPAETTSGSRRILIGILLLAAFLRYYRLDLVSVTNATAIQELTAASALSFEGWDWPLAGPPTDDIRSSAFLPTAIAVTSVFWWHPLSGIVFVIVLNLIAVALTWRLCVRHFGRRAAILATLLYATSPWSILSARLLIPASCLAVFSTAFLSVSLNWLQDKGKLQLAIMVLLAVVLPQIHFSGLVAPVWLVAVLLSHRKDVAVSSVIGGLLAGAIFWVPWIAFQRITGWSELTTWAEQIIQAPAAHAQAFAASLRNVIFLSSSWNFQHWFGGSPSDWPEYFPLWLRWGVNGSAALLSLLLVGAVVRTLSHHGDQLVRQLLLWMGLAVLLGTVLRTGENPDNMLIALPVPFVLIGVLLADLPSRMTRRTAIVPAVIVIVLCVVHVAFLGRWASFVDDGMNTVAGRYQFSYHQRQATIQSVLEDAGTRPVRLFGAFAGGNPAYQYVLMYEQKVRNSSLGESDEITGYWIDELWPTEEISETAWVNQSERRINPVLVEFLRSPPNWVIDRHWSVGQAQIYRMRLAKKTPLQ